VRTIWKFQVPVTDISKIQMPVGARIMALKDTEGYGDIPVWAVVESDAPLVSRIFYIVGTGNPMTVLEEAHDYHYIGTVTQAQGALVWHVFDGGEV